MGANSSSHRHPFHYHQNTIQPQQTSSHALTCQTLHRHRNLRHTSGSSSVAQTPTCEVLRGAQSWSSLTDPDFGGSCPSSTISGHTLKSSICDSVGTMTTKKKRNLSSLATLKKRLVRRAKRASKSFDHGQVMRDFLSNWSTRD